MRMMVARQGSKENIAKTHARQKHLSTAHTPHNMANSLLNLQRTHANRYVQPILSGAMIQRKCACAHCQSESAHQEHETIQNILQSKGSGQPLEPGVQMFMESRFREDFSGVKVHTDSHAAENSKQLNALAYTVGQDIFFSAGQYNPESNEGKRLLAHELTHTIQQGAGIQHVWDALEITNPSDIAEQEAEKTSKNIMHGQPSNILSTEPMQVARQHPAPAPGTKRPEPPPPGTELLKSFADKFPEAAELISKSAPAMHLVGKAEEAGAKFGGYAEEGPAKDTGRAYTVGNTVYVPKARTDKVLAMKSFLFELNNAIRAPKFAELTKEAVKGTKGKLTAKEYAYKKVELEVEGMLKLGEIWFKMKKTIGKDAEWNKYDNDFYLSEYQSVKEGKKTKDDIVKDVLKRVYDSGKLKGKTVEQYYMEQYESLSGGK